MLGRGAPQIDSKSASLGHKAHEEWRVAGGGGGGGGGVWEMGQEGEVG